MGNKHPVSAQILRHTRYLVKETYVNPQQFTGPEEYLAALSEGLEELCLLHGVEPPDLSEVEWRG